MYFKPYLIEKILTGEKTMTRRICKPIDIFDDIQQVVHYYGATGRDTARFRVGQDVAVCPGRGKPTVWYCGTNLIAEASYTPASKLAMALGGFAPLRIRITAIRRERAEGISEADARAEGFANRQAFLDGWKKINGVGKREAEVWCLTFEVVK